MTLRLPLGWLVAASGVLAAGLGWRACHYARLPPFEVALPARRGAHFEIDGMSAAFALAGGDLEIDAAQARPGHEKVGYFRLGISTFVDLRDVRATLRRKGGVAWEVRAATGRLSDDQLVVSGGIVVEEAGLTSQPAELRIALDTGRLVR